MTCIGARVNIDHSERGYMRVTATDPVSWENMGSRCSSHSLNTWGKIRNNIEYL